MDRILHFILKELSPIEIAAAITSLLCVYLTVKNNIWNWLWGIVGVILYGYVFIKGQLYANAGLQILYFLPMQFLGWYVWLRGGPKRQDDLPVTTLTTTARLGWSAATIAMTFALFYGLPPLVLALHWPPAEQTFADALTTAISIAAQYLQTYKKFENWILWIVADLIYTFYLLPKDKLYVSTGLYAIFTVLAVIGAVEWWNLMKRHRLAAAEESRIPGGAGGLTPDV